MRITTFLLILLPISSLFAQKQKPTPLFLDASTIRHEVEPTTFKQIFYVEKLTPNVEYTISIPTDDATWEAALANLVLPDQATGFLEKDTACGGMGSWIFTPSVSKVRLRVDYSTDYDLPKKHWISIGKLENDNSIKPPTGGNGAESSVAVLSIVTGQTVTQLIQDVLIGGNCFDITNVTSFGNANQFAKFQNGSTNVGFTEGVIFGTGNVAISAPGPNNTNGYSNGAHVQTPDADLTSLAGGSNQVYNKAVIEFDFKPTIPNMSFDFVFASEEYCEYVNSQFNDRFGFFISGPGITGPYSGNSQNIALLPNGTVVSINTVNHLQNTTYFHNNQPTPAANNCTGMPIDPVTPAEVQYDGYTVPLTATLPTLQVCSTYHIKLKIADIGDENWESAVFLKKGSFGEGGKAAGVPTVNGVVGNDLATEGCDTASFHFTRVGGDLTQPLTITYTVSGTATSGADFVPFDVTVTFPANSTSAIVPVTIINDGITEPIETIILTLNQPCSCTSKTCTLRIKDPVILNVALPPQNLCGSGSVTLSPTVTGGATPYTYLWDTGATTSSITVSPTTTTTYSLTVTDKCGQTKTVTSTVTVTPAPTATISGSLVVCNNSPASLTIPVTFTGNAPWSITFKVDGVQQTINGITQNPYNLVVTANTSVILTAVSSSGCAGTASGTFTVIHEILNMTATTTNLLCNGSPTGSILVTPTNGSAPYDYVWSPAQGNTNNPTGLAAGTYLVTLTDANGCTKTASYNITQPPVLNVSINGNLPATCLHPDGGAATANGSGGTPTINYVWSNGQSGANLTNATPGSYTVTATDANGCTSTATTTIAGNFTPPNAVAASPNALTCTVLTVPLTGTGSSVPPNITYQWSGGPITGSTTNINATANGPGTFTLLVTNTSNGCTAIATTTVTQNIDQPTAVATSPPPITCTNPTQTISGAGSSSGGGFTYNWSPAGGIVSGGTTLNPVVNQAGTYTLTVTNTANGCTATASATVGLNNTPPIATVAPPAGLNCNVTTIDLNATGSTYSNGATFAWSPAGGIVSGGTTLTPTISAPGTYTLTITQDNGCTATASATVSQNITPPAAVAASPTPISCTNPTVNLTGTGSATGPNITYSWGGPNITGSTTTINTTAGGAGTYTLTVTNTSNGCTNTATTTVTGDNTPPTAVANGSGTVTCTTPTIAINGNGSSTGGNFTYNWSPAGGIVSGGTTLNPTVNQGGTYTLTVTNTTNFCTSTASVTIGQDNQPPVPNIVAPPPLTCATTTVSINAGGSTYSPNATFNWSPAGNIVSGGTTLNPIVNGPGTYTLTITQTNGCTATSSITVSQNITPPAAVAASPTPISCTNPTVNLTGTGSATGPNITYSWGGPNITGSTTTINTTAGGAGTYILTVTNTTNGCTATASTTVSGNNTPPTAVANGSGTVTCTTPTIAINGNGSSTGANFTYNWSPAGGIVSGGTTLNPTVNQGGTYTLTVTNTTNFCTSTASVTIGQDNQPPVPNIVAPPPLNCSNTTISIDATGSNYSSGATFNWSPAGSIVSGGTTLNPVVNAPGTYTLTITQTNGCTAVSSITVSQNITPPPAVASSPTPISCTNPNPPLNGTGSATGPNITYSWSGPNITGSTTTINTTAGSPGTYVLTVTNTTNGCTATAPTTVVGGNDLPIAVANAPNGVTCTTPTVTVNGTGSSTGPNFTYNWSPTSGIVSGGTTLNPVINQGGTYTLTVTNTSNQCTAVVSVTINQDNQPPVPNIVAPPPLNCTNTTISIDATGSTYSSGATFNWSPAGNIVSGGNTLNPSVNGPGTYTLTITQTNGCTAVSSITVSQNITPPTAVATSPTPITCTNPNGPLLGNGSSTGGNFTYNWSGPNITGSTTTLNTTAGSAGTYTLTVTNTTNGCTSTATTTIAGTTDQPTAVANFTGSVTCTTPTISINGSGSSTGGNFTYNWSPTGGIVSGGTTLNPVVNQGGTYTLTVTNTTNNCTSTASVTIPQDNVPPIATILPPQQLNCINAAVEIDAGGSTYAPGATFAWSPTAGIISGGNTLNPLVNVAGNYTLTITQANGCTSVSTVNVVLNNTLPTAVAAAPQQVSCTNPNAPLLGNGSSTGGNFTYNWSGPNITGPTNTINTTAGTPGTYVLTVTNTTNGCTSTASTTVNGSLDLPVAIVNSPGSVTCSTPTLVLSGAGSTTGAGIVYQWTASPGNIVSGGTTLNPTINQGGTYILLVTNSATGCTATDQVTVAQDNVPPSPNVIAPPQLNCVNLVVVIDATNSTYSNGATFSWSANPGGFISGQNTLSPQTSQPGVYTLTITQSNGCTATAQVTVSQNTTLPLANATASGSISCTSPTVPLLGNGSSVGGNFTYEWTTNFGQIVGPTNTLNTTAGLPGTYQILVTNTANGCTATDQVTVAGGIDYPIVTAYAPSDLTCLITSETLNGTGSSTGNNFTYLWTAAPGNIVSGATTLFPVVNQGGNYTLVITNTATNCTASTTVTVVQNTVHPAVVIATPDQLNCINAVVNLDATASFYNPGATFVWTANPGNFLFGQNTPNPQIDQPGSYHLVITNADNGCTDDETVVVIQNTTLPTVNATSSLPISCTNPSVPLLGNGSSTGPNFTYEWSTFNGFINGPTNQLNTTAGEPGQYQLLVSNTQNGCTATDQTTVTGSTYPPTAEAQPADEITCVTTQVALDAGASSIGPNFNYLWTATGGGNIVSGGTTLAPIINAGGSYTLVVTNSTNFCTASTTVVVVQNTEPPTSIIATPDNLNCFNAVVVLDGSASLTHPSPIYQWSTTPPGHIVSGGNTAFPTIDKPGTYQLKVTNSDNGCTNISNVVVIQDITNPTANAGQNQLISCPQPTVTLNGSGSSSGIIFTYFWDTQNGHFTSPVNQPNATADQAGTYTLTVVNNQNGCTASDEVVVTTDVVLPLAEAGPSFTVNCTTPTLNLNGSGSSVGNNFTYLWTTTNGNIVSGATTLNPAINGAGQYNLLVSNSINGCTATDLVQIQADFANPIAVATGGGLLTCSSPTVVLNGTGSSVGPLFNYEWQTTDGHIVSGATTLNPTVNEVGNYSLIVKNTQNGCTTVATVAVGQDNSIPLATIVASGQLDCATTTLNLDASASSNGANFSFVWTTTDGHFSGNQTTLNPSIDQPGTYVLTITNLTSNCSATATEVILQDIAPPPADAGQPATLTCTKTSLEIGYLLPPTDPNLSFTWTTVGGNFVSGETTTNPTIDKPGTYKLLVFNGLNHCSSTATVVISQNITPPTAKATPGGTLTCTTTALVLNGAGSSVGPDFVYQWTTTNGNLASGATTLSPTVDLPGIYVLEITNTSNGCTSTISTTVLQDAALPTAAAASPGILTCAVKQLTLSSNGSTTGQNIGYQWVTLGGHFVAGSQTAAPIVDQPGQYSLTVTNTTNGCTAETNLFVSQDIVPPVAEAGPQATLDCLSPLMVLNGAGSSSGSEFNYFWTTANGGNLVSGMTTLSPIINQPGTYNLLITNTLNGCTATDGVVILKDVNQPTVVLAQPSQLDCDSPTSLINASNSSNGPNLIWTWTPPTATAILSGGNGPILTVGEAGIYILNIVNTTNGCFDQKQVEVLQDITAPPADAGTPKTLTCVATVVTIGGSGNPTGSNFSFNWTASAGGHFVGSQTVSAPKVDKPGIYTLLVTNLTTGCTATDEVEIFQNTTLPTADAGSVFELDCVNTTFKMTATGSVGPSFTYVWTTTSGHFVNSNTVLQPEIDAPGLYTLVITDQTNGCTATDFVQITESANAPIAIAGPPATLTCTVLQTVLNATGSSAGPNFQYKWTTANGVLVSGQTTLMPTVAAPGIYKIEVENTANGCKSIATVVVSEDIAPPVVDAGNEATLTCTQTTLKLSGTASGSASLNYLWTTTNGSIVSGANTPQPTISQPGTYNLLITNNLNGCTASDDVQILADVNLPTIVIAPPATLTCSVLQTSLNAQNGTTAGPNIAYNWTTTDGHFVSQNPILTPTIDKAGTYKLVVTNTTNGCSTSATVVVPQDKIPPVAEAGTTQILTCSNPTTTLNGAGSSAGPNFIYQWTTTNGVLVNGAQSLTPNISSAGSYTLVVTNTDNGCTSSDLVQITPDQNAPVVAIAQPAVLTCANPTAVLNGNGSSSGANFMHEWTTAGGNFTLNQTSLSPTVNQTGSYNLLITNNLNGCTATATVVVSENKTPPTVDAGDGFELTCSVKDGKLHATVSPQTTIVWTTVDGHFVSGTASFTPTVDKKGTYVLTATNLQNGCTASDEVVVTLETNIPNDLLTDLTPPRCDGNVGEITITQVMGGVGPYVYSIDGGLHFFTDNDFTKIQPGTYNLMIQDANGCDWTETLTVPAPMQPAVSLSPEIKIDLGDEVQLEAVLDPNFPLNLIDTIIWSPMTGLSFKSNSIYDLLHPIAKPLKNTIYKVRVISKQGCEAEGRVLVRVDTDPHVWIPNVITPWNKDDFNDKVIIFADPAQVVEIQAFEMFDRWGDKVWAAYNFQPNDPDYGWNGIVREDLLNPAVFVYWAKIKFIDGRVVLYKGDVTIVR